MKYSIIYAVIRPEISEQISIGLIFCDGDHIDVRYSRLKLNAIQALFHEKDYLFVSKVVSQMKRQKRIVTVEDVDYLTRYSNNLITFSPFMSIDVPPTDKSKNWLYRNYVYNRL